MLRIEKLSRRARATVPADTVWPTTRGHVLAVWPSYDRNGLVFSSLGVTPLQLQCFEVTLGSGLVLSHGPATFRGWLECIRCVFYGRPASAAPTVAPENVCDKDKGADGGKYLWQAFVG